VGDGIAGETVKKLMHDEIGILRRYGLDKKYVYLTIKNYEIHRTFRFKMSNLRNIQKNNKEIPCYQF
jgi:hypothetical protein